MNGNLSAVKLCPGRRRSRAENRHLDGQSPSRGRQSTLPAGLPTFHFLGGGRPLFCKFLYMYLLGGGGGGAWKGVGGGGGGRDTED